MLHLVSGTVPYAHGLPLTPEQLGRGLACVRRWNGGTIAPWSVLQHTLAGATWYQQDPNFDLIVLTYWLLHDSEEVYTGDIPAPYKTDQQKEIGRKIRAEILTSYGLPAPPEDVWVKVKEIDLILRASEMECLIHPRLRRERAFNEGYEVDMDACDIIWGLNIAPALAHIQLFGQALRECFESKEVQEFKGVKQ